MITQFTVGNSTVHRVVEFEEAIFDPFFFFPGLTPELLDQNKSWLEPRYIDPVSGKLVLCIQSYVIRTPHHNILVDSCVGNHKHRPHRPFWHQMTSDRYEKNLAATGLAVDDIDYVMCTHLHVDHVGWNTRLENGRWVPTFPKARYLFADRELDHWTERSAADTDACPWIADSVLPIVAAGRHDVVKSDHVLNDIVSLIPTPGHSIDHFSVHVGKEGADAFITGDMVHSPLQMRHPDLSMRLDYDQEQSGRTRRAIFERFADQPTLFCTAHFPQPSVGRLVRADGAYAFISV